MKLTTKKTNVISIYQNWFYIYNNKIYGNKLTSINDKINNKQKIKL